MNAFDPAFMSEVERVRESGLVGSSGRLRELFDFLASRGPQAEPASQIEIAETVVGQAAAEPDDATARVYVHRLRKRLE
jgi:DNA-binding response OmpR family regulator